MIKFNLSAKRIEKLNFKEWQWDLLLNQVVLHFIGFYGLWLAVTGLVKWQTFLFGELKAQNCLSN
jgi:hypothetical protein